MVEMLGVLAVIGLLSVGGIAGYTIAMNKHRANSVVGDLMKRAVIISSQRQLNQPANMNDFGDKVGEYPVGNEVDTSDAGKFKITVEDVSQAVCQNILALSEQWQNASIQANCEQEKNNMTFIFNDDLSGASGENEVPQEPKECSNCAGPCSVCNTQTGECEDDDSKCDQGESCYNGYCSTCEDGEFKKSNGDCEVCSGATVTFPPASPEECYRCSGIRFYSSGSPASNSRCTLCTAEKANATKENCLACSDTVFTSGKSCYYCDPKYADLDRDNRDLGLQACKKKPDIQCDDGWAFIRGTCRNCATEHIITIGTDYEEAKRCFGIETKDSQFGCSAAGTYGCYPFWKSDDSHLMPCKDNRALPSTQEGCLVCNQPNSIYRRYFDSANGTCVYCPSGEYAPDGTPCDELTTESTTAGIAPTP